MDAIFKKAEEHKHNVHDIKLHHINYKLKFTNHHETYSVKYCCSRIQHIGFLLSLSFFVLAQFEQIGRMIRGFTVIKTSDDEYLISTTYRLYVTFQELRELSRVAEKRLLFFFVQ